MIGAGFTYKDSGLLGNINCTCPNCKTKIKIAKSDSIKTKYGYKLKAFANCRCGYSSNVIMKNIIKVDKSDTFKATCKECGSVLNFYSDDLREQSAKGLKNVGQAFSAFRFTASERIEDFNRCSKCGSRKVLVELVDYDSSKTLELIDYDSLKETESLTDKLNNWSAEMKEKNNEKRIETNKHFKEVGGYNKKALGAVIICFILCLTPLFMLGLLFLIPSALWFIIDTLKKGAEVKKRIKESSEKENINIQK